MNTIFDGGINFILWLQSLGNWLVAPMKFFSFLGTEEFFLLFMPILYWCVDAAIGLRVGTILLLSNGLNSALKLAFHSPRPFWYSPKVAAHAFEGSFGIPSGHAQTAAGVWGMLAASLRRVWTWVLLLALIFFIGLSRMFLAVHFPVDVISGWVFGLILLWMVLALQTPVMTWMKKQTFGMQLFAVFLASLALILLAVIAKMSASGFPLPDEWVSRAAAAFPEEEPLNPIELAGAFTSAGAFFGLAGGALWLFGRGGFSAGGPLWKRVLRYPIGLVGVLVLWYGLGAVFPRGETLLAYLLRFLRYGLVGVWLSALSPLVFMKLRLAKDNK
jgi:membrane-associated phospholipid phosphatase